MKLLELAEKIVDPWDLTFAGLSYVLGFAVGIGLAPWGIPASELAALSATGGLTAKQILWRLTARRRIRARGRRFRKLLADCVGNDTLLVQVDRELALLSNRIIDGDQAAKCFDALISEYRQLKTPQTEASPDVRLGPSSALPLAIGPPENLPGPRTEDTRTA
jgi:hypothetical protein